MNYKYKWLMKQNDICGIYKITYKPTGQYYVGKSISIIQSRWPQHSVSLKSGKHSCKPLQLLFNINNSIEDFSWDILEECNKDISPEDLFQRELFHWKEAGTLALNQEPLLNGVLRHSPETLEKMSKVKKGKLKSEETKEKMSVAKIGKKRTPFSKETKEKMSKPRSKETKERMKLGWIKRKEKKKLEKNAFESPVD